MNFTGNSNTLILVHRQMKPVTTDNTVDILLTPQFYTVKKETLPVKYAFQAKRIAPSLFDGLVENLHAHDYFVYKEGDQWVFIAYSIEDINQFLRSKGLEPGKIGKIFFAQQVASQIERPILLDETSALTVLEGTVVIVPRSVLPDDTFMNTEQISLPKKGIQLESDSTSLLTRKQTIVVSLIFVLLGTIWIAEGWRYKKTNRLLEEKREALYRDYPSLQSAYTRDNIVQKYRTIDTQERKKRNVVGKVAGLIFKGVTLTEFDMDQKHFKAVFRAKDEKVAKRLKTLIKRAGFKSSGSERSKEITVEGTL